MPRQHKPQYHAARSCWKFTTGGKTIYFGHEIPRGDRPQDRGIPVRAWKAMNAILEARAPRPVSSVDPTVFALVELYLQWAAREVDEGRMATANYKAHRTHLSKFWEFRGYGDRRAAELEVSDLEAFAQAAAEVHSPHYVANLCRSVQACYNWAVRPVAGRTPARILPANPVKGYKPPAVPVDDRYVQGSLVRRFFRWAWSRAKRKTELRSRSDRMTLLLIRFLFLTGARPGEVCGLRWDEVRWDEGLVVIPPARHKTGKKTGKPREIVVTDAAARILRAVQRLPNHHPEYVFTHRVGKGGRRREASSLEGEPWNSVALSAKVRKWRAEAVADGIPLEEKGAGRFVAYILRHTYATDAIQSGLSYAETAELIGNTSQVTESRYTHIRRSHAAKRARHVAERRRGGTT